MRPSELQYSRHGGLFYADPGTVTTAVPGEKVHDYRAATGALASWRVVDDGPWRYYDCARDDELPEQGWKIHVSSVPDEAEEVLEISARVFADAGTPFKHLRDEGVLRASLAKYGDRVQCGKFIAGYPQDERVAARLMSLLAAELEDACGPVVLGDARWGRAPVFFRYGAFRRLLLEDAQRGLVPALRGPEGALVPDERSTSFTCPDWVDVPESLAPHVAQRSAPNTSDEDWYPYTVDSVLHFSNSGGVYLGSRSDTGEPVVLKEARPFVGLDDSDRWAVDRLRHEAEVMTALADVPAVARIHELREIGGHLFLAEEYVEGVTLNSWVARNYPFSSAEDAEHYVGMAVPLCRLVKEAVEAVHARGYALVDLQPMNIMVTPDGAPRLIDLEAARPVTDTSPIVVGTPGFVGKEGLAPVDNDWFAYNRVVCQLFYPLVPLNAVSDFLVDVQVREALRRLSQDIPFDDLLVPEPPEARQDDVVPLLRPVGASSPAPPVRRLRRALVDGLELVTATEGGRTTIPGDIVSFSGLGRLSIESGLAGAAFTDRIAGALESVSLEDEDVEGVLPRGYLSGADGIRLMRGEPLTGLPPLGDDSGTGTVDASMRSGLSGIVLARAASFLTGTDSSLGKDFGDLVGALSELADDPEGQIVSPGTSSARASGIIDGWSAVALALDTAATLLEDDHLRRSAVRALGKDLEHTAEARDGSLQVLDGGRLMPYLAEGSAGILLALCLVSPAVRSSVDPLLPERLARATAVRCTANGGLLMGRAGLLAVRACAASSGIGCDPVSPEDLVAELAPYCFTTKDAEGALVGGQGGLRLSADYCSGNAGLLWVIDTVLSQKGRGYWSLFPGLGVLGSVAKVA